MSTSQLDLEAGGNFSFPVTPPSEPAAPAAVFGAWPKARRQGHHPHMVKPDPCSVLLRNNLAGGLPPQLGVTNALDGD